MLKNKIGSVIGYHQGVDIEASFKKAADTELKACQLICGDVTMQTPEHSAKIKKLSEEYDVEVTAVWAAWSGPSIWNFYDGPATLGIVPPAYRAHRLNELISGANFAYNMGVTDVITHVGFIPENPDDPNYQGVVSALRYLCNYLNSRGQYFLFETGQETPVVLLRTIEEVGTGNLGINLDTANLILYGKANTVDALDVIGKYVRNTHCKDGLYPTTGKNLGHEVALGQGKANFPGVFRKLKELNYTGPYIIERE
ncbi:MAG: sugar phosphate isomerase/epimerase, partial [Oscillospiraceae bacterium]|nr:sugar phosphate isomerase/epimerase [Oscillospiraceae bacterium]